MRSLVLAALAVAIITGCRPAVAPSPSPAVERATTPTAAVGAADGTAHRGAAAVTVQPGLPGQAGRVLTPSQADALPTPPHTPADVAFMSGMIAHHEQALVMTDLVDARTEARDIKLLALRIALSQTDEITLMKTWLRQRNEPVPGEGEHAGHDMMDHGDHGLMPGMLTTDELSRLRGANGAAFDKLFLEFMIKHHEGAVIMVADLFASQGGGQQSEIYSFASDVEADQQMEIARMRRMLADRL
jgi:uncharacterized protein (DUF305 family)